MSVLEFDIADGADPLAAWREISRLTAEHLGLGSLGAAALPSLEKSLRPQAAPTHHSQFQQRGSGGHFTPAAQARVRDDAGKFVRRLDAEERELATERAFELIEKQVRPRFQDHLADFQSAGREDTFRSRMERDLRYFYEEVYRYGKRAAGDPGLKLTPRDRAILNRLVRDELHYLERFTRDLVGETGKMPPSQRLDYYAQATREAYWTGWVLGDLRKARMIRWEMGPTQEKCGDCIRFAERGWLPALRFLEEILAQGYAPQSGQLECLGYHCQCKLKERVDA